MESGDLTSIPRNREVVLVKTLGFDRVVLEKILVSPCTHTHTHTRMCPYILKMSDVYIFCH